MSSGLNSISINGVLCNIKKHKESFWEANYNGIVLILSQDKTKFYAQDLMNKLCDRIKKNGKQCTKCVIDWLKTRKAKILLELHPDWVIQYKYYKATWFLDLRLLHAFATSCDNIKGELWVMGEQWNDDVVNDGFIYLVQTSIHVDKNIYKIGRTWNLKKRFVQYGKEVKILKTIKVRNQLVAEDILINSFKDRFDRAKKEIGTDGKEYFMCSNDVEAIKTFDDVVKELDKMDLIIDDEE